MGTKCNVGLIKYFKLTTNSVIYKNNCHKGQRVFLIGNIFWVLIVGYNIKYLKNYNRKFVSSHFIL